MNIETFNPHLLECHYQDFCDHVGDRQWNPWPARITRFHEIDIITYGEGLDIVQGKEYRVETGDVFYRTDGLHNIHYRPYYCYFLVFDPIYDAAREPLYKSDIVGEENWNYSNSEPWDPIPPFDFSTGPRLGKLTDVEPVIRLAAKLQAAWNSIPRDGLLVKMLFLNLLYEIRRQLCVHVEQTPYTGKYVRYLRSITNLCTRIHNSPNSEYTVQQMAEMLRLSPNFFSRVFHDIVGMPPMEYVRKCKLEQIKSLLISTEMSISEIATRCNFEDSNYFRTFFRRYVGMTPNEYRESILSTL